MPLFSRFRHSFGESRPVIDAPGHLVMREEADDAISILAVSMLFFWDCHVLTASGRDVLFVHDEFGWFGSRDISLVASVGRHLEAALGTESSG